ncbi:hypothetical protein CON36_22665 [Bacillus cereus]|uniref:Uncharacterized protein n=1 Tax=Bacillus cereus TaxID=1396 RepID=A0A9X6SWA8_BACCE|nr:hypothetical protein [Bacillus cereus]PDZ96296.1 hypothetical protein CON36_22665 [Bacillus cereus]
MANVAEREAQVNKEKNRLRGLFKDIPHSKLKVVEGLIVQAARLRVLLNEMWVDISENGDYEMFSQSDKTEPYERERPVARLYNNRDQAYQRIIKQLTDLLPEDNNKREVKTYSVRDLV